MGRRLPMMRAREVIALLRRTGWVIDRQTGAHVMMTQADGTGCVVIPNHPGDLRQGTLRGIIEQAGLTVDEFLQVQ